MTCHDWINQALVCTKPFDKIAKYEYRFTKVAKDALWHLFVVKNCDWPRPTNPSRYRRDTFQKVEKSYDSQFEFNFDNLYIKHILENKPKKLLKLSDTEGSGMSMDDAKSLGRMSERDKMSERLEEKTVAELQEAQNKCKVAMDK